MSKKIPTTSKFAKVVGVQTLIRRLKANDEGAEITESEIDDLFDYIGVGTRIPAFLVVLSNFTRITKRLTDICTKPQWFFSLDTALFHSKTADTILRHKDALLTIQGFLPVDKNKNKFFHGIIKVAPFYATIGFVAERSHLLANYDQLQAQFLVAYTNLLKLGSVDDPNKALQAIRSLATRDEDLARLPVSNVPHDEYIDHLRRLPHVKGLPDLLHFFTYSQHKTFGISLAEARLLYLPPAPRPEKPDRNKENEECVKIVEQQDLQDDDAEPAPSEVYIGITTSPNVSHADLKRQARAIAFKRAKQHQVFDFDWEELSYRDLKLLLDFIMVDGEAENVPVRAALGLMLFYGFALDRVSRLGFDASTSPQGHDIYLADVHRLRIYSPGPVFKTTLEHDAVIQAETKNNYVDLDIPDFLERLIQQFQIYPSYTGSQLHHLCRRALSECYKKQPHRLTTKRIEQYLQRVVMRLERGDSATASLTFGKKIYLARTRIHYSSFNQVMLREQHTVACQTILARVKPAMGSDTQKCQDHVGTPVRPKIDSVINLIESLKKDMASSAASLGSVSELAKFHNQYTLYTILMMDYSTAYRAVNAPYVLKELRDECSGACIVRDKDVANYSHSRLVWLTKECLTQLKFYERHCGQVLTLATGKPDKKSLKPIFFLAENGNVIEASRTEVVDQLKQHKYYLPPNTHRHFLKSYLQETGCPAELVEYFLGHWHLGEEPWVGSSGLSPLIFKSQMMSHLEPLFKKLGLRALRGIKEIPSRLAANATLLVSTNCSKDSRPPSIKLPKLAPDAFWFSLLPKCLRDKSADDAFTDDQKIVLKKIYQFMPELYRGDRHLILSDEQVAILVRRIKHKRMSQSQLYRRLSFLAKALGAGKQRLHWDVKPFVPPIHVVINKIRMRPVVLKGLNHFRWIEKSFIADLEHPAPSLEIAYGQILVSAILFGGLHTDTCLPAFLRGLGRPYQWGKMLWVDLWLTKEPLDLLSRWNRQRNSSNYRRFIVDPLTQILIYRLQLFPEWQDRCLLLSPDQLFCEYADHIRTTQHIKLPNLSRLMLAAKAWATCHLPPFLAAFAAAELSSASVPDPVWFRLLTRDSYSNPGPKRRSSVPLLSEFLIDQKKLLETLRRAIRKARTSGAALQCATEFLEMHDENLFPVTRLLIKWAVQLLSKRIFVEELRNISPESPVTVRDYLGCLVDVVLLVVEHRELTEMDKEKVNSVVTAIILEIHPGFDEEDDFTDGDVSQRVVYKLERLKQFLAYLELFHQIPCPSISEDIRMVKKSLNGENIAANVITETDFIRLKKYFTPPFPERHHQLMLIVCILAFRTGLRPDEILGLLVDDLRGGDQLELLVRNNKWRSLKSDAGERRIPLYSLLTEDEQDLLIEWRRKRYEEPGCRRNMIAPLLTMNSALNIPCSRGEIIDPVADALQQITGDYTLTVYSLRHSFAAWLLLSLLPWPEEVNKDDIPAFLQVDQMAPLARNKIRASILHNCQSGRKALYSVAALLGHAETSTLLANYMHVCDWLYHRYLQDPGCAPRLTPKALAQLTGCSMQRSYHYLKSGQHPLVSQIDKQAKQYKLCFEHPLQADGKTPGRTHHPLNKPRYPAFDQLLIERIPSVRRKKMAPETVLILRALYDRVAREMHPRSASHAARQLIQGYRQHDNAFVFYDPRQAEKALMIFQYVGIEPLCRYYGSRWHDKDKMRRQVIKWRDYLPYQVSIAAERSQQKSPHGLLRIFPLHMMLKKNQRVSFEPDVMMILMDLLSLLSEIYSPPKEK